MINISDIPKLSDKHLEGAYQTALDLLKEIVIEQHTRENEGT